MTAIYRPIEEYLAALAAEGKIPHDPFATVKLSRPSRKLPEPFSDQEVKVLLKATRHTFARKYLLNGGDPFSLQQILGHSSLQTVRLYVNLWSTDIQAQHRKFSPADSLMGRQKVT